MSEFVGRTGSQRVFSYPETRRSGPAQAPYARNFASGPKNGTDIPGDPGLQINWNTIDVGTDPSTDVPITPAVTGIVRIAGVVIVQNDSVDAVNVSLYVQVDGVTLAVPQTEIVTVPADGFVAIPFLTETIPSETPVGVTSNVQVLVVAGNDPDVAQLVGGSSSIDVQEVSVATG